MNPIVQFVSANWASRIAADIDAATTSATLSALSCLPPRRIGEAGISRLWLAMVSAAARGRSITLILPASTRTHPATAHNDATARYCADLGIKTHLHPMPRLLHAKTALVDSRVSWIGSGNLTTAATTHNHEAWIRAEDRQTALELAAFHHDIINN